MCINMTDRTVLEFDWDLENRMAKHKKGRHLHRQCQSTTTTEHNINMLHAR